MGILFWKMIMPLTLTVIISWITFWVDIGDLQTELAVSITLFLTMVAFSITLDFSLPKVSYLTWMDKFQFLCFTFVFLVAIENVIVKNIEIQRKALAHTIRSRRRWLFPLGFCLVNAVLFAWMS